jgi:hypothetical protein
MRGSVLHEDNAMKISYWLLGRLVRKAQVKRKGDPGRGGKAPHPAGPPANEVRLEW